MAFGSTLIAKLTVSRDSKKIAKKLADFQTIARVNRVTSIAVDRDGMPYPGGIPHDVLETRRAID